MAIHVIWGGPWIRQVENVKLSVGILLQPVHRTMSILIRGKSVRWDFRRQSWAVCWVVVIHAVVADTAVGRRRGTPLRMPDALEDRGTLLSDPVV